MDRRSSTPDDQPLTGFVLSREYDDSHLDRLPPDHVTPKDGACFVGLNFTDEQMSVFTQAICATGNDETIEESVARICREWLAARQIHLKHDPLTTEV